MTKILRIDASQRREGSASRALTDALIATLDPGGDAEIVHLDLAETSVPPLTAEWIEARTVAPEDQTERQQEALSGSDALIAALREADILVIGSPLYNFAIPAPLKAWIDMIARPRLTFRYTENGPEGLLKGKTAYLALATGGAEIGSPIDFATPYLRHVLGFVGIDDVRVFAADKLGGGDDALRQALAEIEALKDAA